MCVAKVMYRCVCARHCAVETDTQQGYQQRVLRNRQTWDPTLFQHSSCHRRMQTIPRQQGNLRLSHLQCSQFAWSRNKGRATSSHAADSVTFAERVQEIPSPDQRKKYTRVVNTVLRYSNVLHLHRHVCHEISDSLLKIVLACNSSHHVFIRS